MCTIAMLALDPAAVARGTRADPASPGGAHPDAAGLPASLDARGAGTVGHFTLLPRPRHGLSRYIQLWSLCLSPLYLVLCDYKPHGPGAGALARLSPGRGGAAGPARRVRLAGRGLSELRALREAVPPFETALPDGRNSRHNVRASQQLSNVRGRHNRISLSFTRTIEPSSMSPSRRSSEEALDQGIGGGNAQHRLGDEGPPSVAWRGSLRLWRAMNNAPPLRL